MFYCTIKIVTEMTLKYSLCIKIHMSISMSVIFENHFVFFAFDQVNQKL